MADLSLAIRVDVSSPRDVITSIAGARLTDEEINAIEPLPNTERARMFARNVEGAVIAKALSAVAELLTTPGATRHTVSHTVTPDAGQEPGRA